MTVSLRTLLLPQRRSFAGVRICASTYSPFSFEQLADVLEEPFTGDLRGWLCRVNYEEGG